MEEDGWGYGGGAQAGLQNHNTSVLLLREKKAQYKRMAKILAVILVLVLAGALPLLLTVLLGRQHVPPDGQPTVTPASLSGYKPETLRPQDFENPSAMLTAPRGNQTNGMYLQWEHNFDNAYCRGGFNYSNGDLVVPRDGVYSVFLQITYGWSECPHRIRLMNKVVHVAEGYKMNVTLLSSSHTVRRSKEDWSKSLYTAGLFFLKAKDRLHATSTHPEYIAKNQYEMFFGAVLYPH